MISDKYLSEKSSSKARPGGQYTEVRQGAQRRSKIFEQVLSTAERHNAAERFLLKYLMNVVCLKGPV